MKANQNGNTGIRAMKGIIQGVMARQRPYLGSKEGFPGKVLSKMRTER